MYTYFHKLQKSASKYQRCIMLATLIFIQTLYKSTAASQEDKKKVELKVWYDLIWDECMKITCLLMCKQKYYKQSLESVLHILNQTLASMFSRSNCLICFIVCWHHSVSYILYSSAYLTVESSLIIFMNKIFLIINFTYF